VGGTYSQIYGYSAPTGNLDSKAGQTLAYADTNHPHAATGMGSNVYSYDANGNMTSRQIASGTYTLSYDAEGRLVSISGGGISATYTYNGDGERVKVVITSGSDTQITAHVGDYFEISVGDPRQLPTPTQPNCSTNYCVYFPLVMSSSLSIPAGHAWTSYFYVNGQRVAMRVKSNQEGVEEGVYYLLTDHLGSTAITLDSGANQVAELRYFAWGETRYTNGNTPTQRRYTGQLEAEAGLYFYNARFYDSFLGRFAQADMIVPLASQGVLAWDRYAYSSNNPINFTDPSGHFAIVPMLIGGGIGALVGGIVGGAMYYAGNQQSFDKTEFWVAVGGGAVAGAFVGSGLGILSAAGTTVAAATTATAMISGGSSAAITEAVYMAENQNNFESTPYLTNAAVSGSVAALTANPSVSFAGKVAINVAGNEISYLSNTKSDQWSLQGGIEAGVAGAFNALAYEGMSFVANEYLMMNNPIGKLGFPTQGCSSSLVEVAVSERLRTGVGNALLGLGSGGTTAISNWVSRNLVKWE
jgi:RHS repeat-associated protein